MRIEAPLLGNLAGIAHGFFTREGGVSEGIYESLNCGLGSNDVPEHVAENRARAMVELGFDADALTTLYQVHSSDVVTVTEPLERAEVPEADGLVTKTPGVVLGILTADCAPVLFADAEAGVVGACHAGWKGALGGVVEATVQAMVDLGAATGRIKAVIGPCIRQQSYEVGEEFLQTFLQQEATSRDFFAPGMAEGKFHFDLPGYVAQRLALADIGFFNAAGLELDTCKASVRFFSYRRATKRGEPDYGRQLSAIGLTGG